MKRRIVFGNSSSSSSNTANNNNNNGIDEDNVALGMSISRSSTGFESKEGSMHSTSGGYAMNTIPYSPSASGMSSNSSSSSAFPMFTVGDGEGSYHGRSNHGYNNNVNISSSSSAAAIPIRQGAPGGSSKAMLITKTSHVPPIISTNNNNNINNNNSNHGVHQGSFTGGPSNSFVYDHSGSVHGLNHHHHHHLSSSSLRKRDSEGNFASLKDDNEGIGLLVSPRSSFPNQPPPALQSGSYRGSVQALRENSNHGVSTQSLFPNAIDESQKMNKLERKRYLQSQDSNGKHVNDGTSGTGAAVSSATSAAASTTSSRSAMKKSVRNEALEKEIHDMEFAAEYLTLCKGNLSLICSPPGISTVLSAHFMEKLSKDINVSATLQQKMDEILSRSHKELVAYLLGDYEETKSVNVFRKKLGVKLFIDHFISSITRLRYNDAPISTTLCSLLHFQQIRSHPIQDIATIFDSRYKAVNTLFDEKIDTSNNSSTNTRQTRKDSANLSSSLIAANIHLQSLKEEGATTRSGLGSFHFPSQNEMNTNLSEIDELTKDLFESLQLDEKQIQALRDASNGIQRSHAQLLCLERAILTLSMNPSWIDFPIVEETQQLFSSIATEKQAQKFESWCHRNADAIDTLSILKIDGKN